MDGKRDMLSFSTVLKFHYQLRGQTSEEILVGIDENRVDDDDSTLVPKSIIMVVGFLKYWSFRDKHFNRLHAR